VKRAAYPPFGNNSPSTEKEKRGYAMKDDTIVGFRSPGSFVHDPLSEVLRAGARKLLAQAIEEEVEAFLAKHRHLQNDEGHQRVVRNGYLPEREIQTGVGPVEVKVPRIRDKAPGKQPIQFSSGILPKYLRRTKSIDELIPWLYLKGVSTGDMSEALACLAGANASGFSASTVSRLKEVWQKDQERWSTRDLAGRRYVYFWADGVYFNVRCDENRPCILVIIGATEEGRKELVAIGDGFRESELSWKELLLDLKGRGLAHGPSLAIGDGALGFWKAMKQVYGETGKQRCWVHKMANVLNRLPKSLQSQGKKDLQAIWMAPSRAEAEKAFDHFLAVFGAKYPKACENLAKDREDLLAFFDFPAEHWKHIRTTNPIESTFATVRLRTDKTRNCYTGKTVLAMVFQLLRSAAKKWRILGGAKLLAEVVRGVKFVDGIQQEDAPPLDAVHNI
jgi:putative transposase